MARREVEHWVCGACAVEPLRAQLEHGLAVGEGVGAAAQPRRGLQQLHAGDEAEVRGHWSLHTEHLRPALPSSSAALSPAMPPPTTTQSQSTSASIWPAVDIVDIIVDISHIL